jgi:hypothetical protein
VLVLLRFASLRFQLKGSPEAGGRQAGKEAPMRVTQMVMSSALETAWSLAVSVAGGLLLS